MTSSRPAIRRKTPTSLTLLGVLWGLVTLGLAFPYQPHVMIDHTVMGGGASSTIETLAPHPRLWVAACLLTALCAAAAPVLAHRMPRTAWVASLAPLVPLAVESSGFNLSLSCISSLVGVASVVLHRNRRLGWLIGGAALAIPLIFTAVPTSALWVVRDVIVASSGAETSKRIVMFAMYAVGTVLALGTATALSLHASRREERQIVAVREAEVDARAALARDLHDVVAHRMSLVAVRAETAPYSLGELSPQTRQAFSDIAIEARGALDEMRTVLGVLDRSSQVREPHRDPQPQVSDIPQLIAETRGAGASVELVGDVPDVDALIGTTVFRVVQESLTNARRHAPSETATVRIVRAGADVTVRVSNPCSATTLTIGRGLGGMRERVEQCGGRFDVKQEHGEFVVEAVLPTGGPGRE